tara:strand:+ start:128 stop:244 length:117 start_codon:yes stop_codon:yes gene_type:complete
MSGRLERQKKKTFDPVGMISVTGALIRVLAPNTALPKT